VALIGTKSGALGRLLAEDEDIEPNGSDEAQKKGAKRLRPPRLKDRKKHNEAETMRRRRMKEAFVDLARLCGLENPTNAHKASILKAAAIKLQGIKRENDENPKKRNHPRDEEPAPKKEPEESRISADEFQRITQHLSKENQDLLEYKRRAETVLTTVVQSLKHQLNHYSIFNCSNLPEDLITLDGQFVDCNVRLTDMLGYTKQELMDPNTSIWSLTHPDSVTTTCLFLQTIMNSRKVHQIIKRLFTRDHNQIWVQVSAWLVCDPGSKPYGIRAVFDLLDYSQIASINRQRQVNRQPKAGSNINN